MAGTLFSPFTFKGLTLPNRIVMAPMTRSFSPGGVATAEVAAYYRRRAENQASRAPLRLTIPTFRASMGRPNWPPGRR